ncbi:hypothetical protein EV1_004597 [Malus domestica]
MNRLDLVQNRGKEQTPEVKSQLLEADSDIILLETSETDEAVEVAAAENGLVKDVGLEKESGLAGAHELAEVELADPAGDLTDFPTVQPDDDELRAVLLLVLPQAHVGLEDLAKVVLVVEASVGRNGRRG